MTRMVKRRDGSSTSLDVTKIRRVLEWACEGLDISPIAAETSFDLRFKDKITTREIQSTLIEVCRDLVSVEEPDWLRVAGRLIVWGLWKEAKIAREVANPYDDYPGYVLFQTKSGIYDSAIFDYAPEELQVAGKWIDPKYDLDYDYGGAKAWEQMYLLPGELPQQALLTIALLLARKELPQERLAIARIFYEDFARRYISPATPILLNLRRPNGNLSSCFILAADDSLKSIFQTLTDVAEISTNGGGVGVNLSRIRATGSWLRGVEGINKGLIPWCPIFNATAIAVDQGGKRAGAVTLSLGVYHLDIEEFLELRSEVGDPRRKARDIFPQLVIPDEFMRRVQRDEDWTLVDPYEVRMKLKIELAETWGTQFENVYREIEEKIERGEIKNFKKIRAKEFFKAIMRSQLATGLPYLVFVDEINRRNPNQHVGMIPATNLCTESYSNVKPHKEAHTCNLMSINLANVEMSQIGNVCSSIVRMLDNALELSTPPIPESATHNQFYRTIGIGMMGLQDFLARENRKYSESLDRISEVSEEIAYWSIVRSMELAIERGAAPSFAGSLWSKGHLLGRSVEEITAIAASPDRWVDLSLRVKQFGIRNSQLLAIAPNSSTAILQGCCPGVLPVYRRLREEGKGRGTFPVAPPYLKEKFWYYEENAQMNQTTVIDAVTAIQPWIDTGISMELVFDLSVTNAKEIYDLFVRFWKQGGKATYYVRTITRANSEECVSCAS